MQTAVLITGVSTGIGHAIVKYLLEKGFYVYGTLRWQEDVERLTAEWGENFHPLLMDVTDPESIHAAASKVKKQLGNNKLAALINNAGIAVAGSVQEVPLEQWRLQFEVNVLGLVAVTQQFLPLLDQKQGKIINMSSVSGFLTSPFLGPYAASKHAVESLSDALRRELDIISGIKVIVVEPGPVQSEIWDKSKKILSIYKDSPFQKILDNQVKYFNQVNTRALPASEVAQLVFNILKHPDPKTRYVIVAKKWRIQLAKWLPDEWLDNRYRKAFRKIMGL